MAGRGSAPGERRGGRQKGTPNRFNAARAAAIAESGVTPLSFMLSVLRDEDAPAKARMWAAVAAAPYCHAKPRPVAANAGGVEVQVVHITHEQRLAELDALDEIDARTPIEKNNREQFQPVDQAQPVESAMDRMEVDWFSMAGPGAAHEPALPPQMSAPTPMPAPKPTPPPPPQPPAPAVVAAPVPHENRPIHRANGNGTSTTQPQRVNGHPRPDNGAVVRRSDDEIRNISDRRRAISDYPATHPVHGIV